MHTSHGYRHHTEYCKRGEDLKVSKLTEVDVKQIRELHEWKQSEIKRLNAIASAGALAGKFGVTKRTIESVLSYRTWRHVL